MFAAQECRLILAALDAAGAPMDDASRLELLPKPVRGTKEFIPKRHVCRLAFQDDISSLSKLKVNQPREELDCSADVRTTSGLLHLVASGHVCRLWKDSIWAVLVAARPYLSRTCLIVPSRSPIKQMRGGFWGWVTLWT